MKFTDKLIGNENKRKRIFTNSEPPTKSDKIPKGSRSSHSYNVFCSENSKSGTVSYACTSAAELLIIW